LERFIPEFEHARGLLQFNQYHKYTVDEHCIRAVDFATKLWTDTGPLGRVYRPLAEKHILHLALLIHDLGKGHLEDHREVGIKIAESVAKRLELSPQETEALRFLVHKHMLLNHLAFRRDTADEQLAVQFAVQVGSPKLLQMLYLMTAADLGAVGPDVWDGWKQELVTDLYHRTMQHLAGESPETTIDELLSQIRDLVREAVGEEKRDPWIAERISNLPMAYLHATLPQQIAEDVRLLRTLKQDERGKDGVLVASYYQPETETVQITIATSETLTPGIFHKITGALSSHGLNIFSAQIHTLVDGLVIDRFCVRDPDFAGEPHPHRLMDIERSVVQALKAEGATAPVFRRTWQSRENRPTRLTLAPTRVNIDNSTSNDFTIVDIFTHDRTGLLYAITRRLFELGLSVGRAKVGTFTDQVVDVFYVTDQHGRKIHDQARLEEIQQGLLNVIEKMKDAATG
jgi:[protein-PII] uridylyltransferase